MMGKQVIPAFLIALAMGCSVVGSGMLTEQAVAAEKKVSAALGVPIGEAQQLMKAGKCKEALAKLKTAGAMPNKSPYEQYLIDEMSGYCSHQTKDFAGAAKYYEATINSGQLSAQQVAARQKVIAQLYNSAGNYAKATSMAQVVLKANPNDTGMQMMLASAAYKQKDFATATRLSGDIVKASAGRAPPKDALEILQSSQFEQKKSGALSAEEYGKTLELLVRYYPSPRYWEALLANAQGLPGVGKRQLEVDRLRLACNAMSKPEDYVGMAQRALLVGLPAEAKVVLESGFKAGVLGKGTEGERHKRLLERAKTEAAADQQALSATDAEAATAQTGDPSVKLGDSYASYGQYDKAIKAIESGIAKGVTNANDAKLSLGRAYLAANQKAKAKQTFASIDGKDGASDVAKLWLLRI